MRLEKLEVRLIPAGELVDIRVRYVSPDGSFFYAVGPPAESPAA